LIKLSAGVNGDGRLLSSTLRVAVESIFSWELTGSIASLLGTGVMFAAERRLATLANELDFVVDSLRQGDESPSLALFTFLAAAAGFGVEEEGPLDNDALLEKNPRMLCCFPVDACAEDGFFAVEGGFAGVRATRVALSPIITLITN
jgi:hypothetical protein